MDRPPIDPADHSEDFAHRWVDRLENAVEGRMHALDVPEEQIGASDHPRGVAWRTFFPHEREGGGVSPDGRITVDSGVLNPSLMDHMGADAAGAWSRARLRDRIDATIAHEYEEARSGSHDHAVAHAADTDLPLDGRARRLLRRLAGSGDAPRP